MVEIWYQLFVNGNTVDGVDIIAIEGVPTIIAIREAVKAKRANGLKDYDAVKLKVYAYADDKQETSLDLVAEWNPSEHGGRSPATPLIVTAVDSVPAKGPDEQKAQTKGENYVNSIMRDYKEIDDSNGMRLLRNVSPLEASSQPENIIVRSITEPFWNACLKVVDDSKGSTRVAAIGTPGIGKTTSTAILIRMLLKKGKTVVYLVRTLEKTSWYYEFTPSNSEDTPSNPKVQVRVYPERNGPNPVESLNHNTTYFIIDPGQTQDNCLPSLEFSPKIILVSSPDEKHWGGNEFEKERNHTYGIFMYFPVWSLEELEAARNSLKPDLTPGKLIDRYSKFGGVPRNCYVTDEKAELLFTKQDQAISALNESQLRQLAIGNIDGVERTTSKAPMSALIGFFPGKRDDFSDATIEIISPFVGDKILARHIDKIWKVMLSTEFGRYGLFESHTRFLLMQKRPYEVKEMLANDKKTKVLANNKKKERTFTNFTDTVIMELGGCTSSQMVRDIVISAKKSSPHILFYPLSTTNRLTDFLYKDNSGHFHAFQVTVGTTHTANIAHIKHLEEQIGDPSKLSLYYSVIENRFDAFVTKPANVKDKGVLCGVFKVKIGCDNDNATIEKTSTTL